MAALCDRGGAFAPTAHGRVWPAGPDWSGATCVILASGPSLTRDDAQLVRAWRAADVAGTRRVIAINTTYQLAPWADVLYACDARWWDRYFVEAELTCLPTVQFWTQDAKAAKFAHRVRHVQSVRSEGLNRQPGVINQGSNSGFQALNLAWQFGAQRLILLGFDMQATGGRSHWHGDHPDTLNSNNPYRMWLDQFGPLARDLAKAGAEVINCTPTTALTCFERAPLAHALGGE